MTSIGNYINKQINTPVFGYTDITESHAIQSLQSIVDPTRCDVYHYLATQLFHKAPSVKLSSISLLSTVANV